MIALRTKRKAAATDRRTTPTPGSPSPVVRYTKSERTRRQLLIAAAKVFSERGYSNTRVSDIVSVVGIHPASIYYHFPSKDAFVAELLATAVSIGWRVVHLAVENLPADASPIEHIATSVYAHMCAVLEVNIFVAAALRIIGEVPEDIRKDFRNLQKEYMDYWDDLLAKAAKSGEIDPDLDIRILRVIIINAMGGRPEWYTGRKSLNANKIADHIMASLINGITTPKGKRKLDAPQLRDTVQRVVEGAIDALGPDIARAEEPVSVG